MGYKTGKYMRVYGVAGVFEIIKQFLQLQHLKCFTYIIFIYCATARR